MALAYMTPTYTPPLTIVRAATTGKPSQHQSLEDMVQNMDLQQLLRQSKGWVKTLAYFVQTYPKSLDSEFMDDYHYVKDAPLALIQAINGRTHLEEEARELSTGLLRLLSEVSSAVQGSYRSIRSDEYIRESSVTASLTADANSAI